MNIIIPMAGYGQRFVDAGYREPKPILEVGNRLMVQHVLDMFPREETPIFICNQAHATESRIISILRSLRSRCKIVTMGNHKLGPVHTVLAASDLIRDDEPVIIAYCDGTSRLNLPDFIRSVTERNLDGCLVTHTGFHPHTLSTTKMAFVQETNGLVSAVKEKSSYTDDPMSEHASSGVYYFRTGKMLKHYFQAAMQRGESYNGEFYVTLVYNLLIKDGLRVGYYDTSHVAILGTPEEVRNFEAWKVIATNPHIKTSSDLLNCYNYWRSYHAPCPTPVTAA